MDWLEELEEKWNTYAFIPEGGYRLIAEVKRLREENAELRNTLEVEHEQGESFILQIKFMMKEIAELKKPPFGG